MRDALEIAQTIAIVVTGGGLIYLIMLIRRVIAELRAGQKAANARDSDSEHLTSP